jgi:excisionase family DNA binding protein
MSGMVVLAIDPDTAGHLAVALRRHRDSLHKNQMSEPPALAELEKAALQVVSKRQQPSANVSVPGDLQDDLSEREFLTRADVVRLTGASVATVDRWIARGQLPSCRHGRLRRIARADLNTFLAAT